MASIKQYAYYLEGSRLAIVEKDTAFDNNVGSKEYGPGIARQQWKSPTSSVSSGIEIKYVTAGTENLVDETSELNLPTYLSKALVYYVKAKLIEDTGNFEMKEYLMKEFKKMIEKHESSKISGIRMMSPGPHGIR
jgi:hypothetical protein|tara:strand:- start:1251 stop:1655 length:405 start_codon:yes stop_codon:yes gene_type:complete